MASSPEGERVERRKRRCGRGSICAWKRRSSRRKRERGCGEGGGPKNRDRSVPQKGERVVQERRPEELRGRENISEERKKGRYSSMVASAGNRRVYPSERRGVSTTQRRLC